MSDQTNAPPPRLVADASSLQPLARAFNVASNPARLQILLLLADGGLLTLGEIHDVLGGERRLVHQHVDALVKGNLARSHRLGKVRSFELTEGGRRLVRSMTVSPESEERNEEVGPAPLLAPELPPLLTPEGADPLTYLVARLKAFADPVRLRLLNLLAGSTEVCVCHMHEALGLPQSTVSRHLTTLKEAGLISGQRRGAWVYYRLVEPADDLGRLIGGRLGGISDLEGFIRDRRELDGLEACSSASRLACEERVT